MPVSFSSARELLVSVAGSVVFSAVLVAAAVIPAQTAFAATFGL